MAYQFVGVKADPLARKGLSEVKSQLAELSNNSSLIDGVKHRALLIPSKTAYYFSPVYCQLASQGIMVQCTSMENFVKHYDELVKDFDILIISQSNSMTGTVDQPWRFHHLQTVTAQEAYTALNKWLFVDNKKMVICYSNGHGRAIFYKHNVEGTAVETVNTLNATLKMRIINAKTSQDSFNVTDDCPLTADEIFDTNLSPIQQTYIQTSALGEEHKKWVSYKDGDGNEDVFVYADPARYCVVYNGGYNINDYSNSPFFRYINIGAVARYLIGNTTKVRLAMDCINNKKIAASGIDCDLGYDADAIDVLVNAYNGKPLELGITVNNVENDEEFAKLRSFGSNVHIVSHSKYHFAGDGIVVVTGETHTIPESRIIRLKHPFRVTDRVVRLGGTALTEQDFLTVLTESQYGYLDTKCILKFHANHVGETVAIDYKYAKENEEWVGSLKILEDKGALSKNALYLTGGGDSIHATTASLLRDKGVTVCDYEVNYLRNYYLAEMGMEPVFVPYLCDVTSRSFKHFSRLLEGGWTKTEVETEKTQEAINTANSKFEAFKWYDHDFIYNSTHAQSLFRNINVDSSWKGASYAEAKVLLTQGLKNYLDAIDAEGVVWMLRSEYHKRYYLINKYLIYSVEESDGKTYIHVQNTGNEPLKGITFRVSDTVVSAKALPNKELPIRTYAGHDLLCLDVSAGEKITIEIVTSAT